MYHNPCKFMYLEQEENNSLFSYLPLAVFYSTMGYYAIKFINYLNNENIKIEEQNDKMKSNYIYQSSSSSFFKKSRAKNYDESLENNVNNIKDEEKYNELPFINLSERLDSSLIEVIKNMLSSKSLERVLVIYYIFVKKGNYKVKTENADSFEEYNSYLEFNKYDDYFAIKQKIADLDDSEYVYEPYEVNKLFNLDNSLDANKKFFIGEKEYNINEGHFNMISWVYYSGLYEYLTTNLEVKNKVLKEMNENKLLTGNLFLRYQMLQLL